MWDCKCQGMMRGKYCKLVRLMWLRNKEMHFRYFNVAQEQSVHQHTVHPNPSANEYTGRQTGIK